jgi:hypothetical protein
MTMENEEIKAAVIAECERLCPTIGADYFETSLNIRVSKVGESKWVIGFPFGVQHYCDVEMNEWTANIFYRLLVLKTSVKVDENPDWDYHTERRVFQWAKENNDLGWATDGRHTFQSVYEHGLINGAKYGYSLAGGIDASPLVAALEQEMTAIRDWYYTEAERPDFECMIIRMESALDKWRNRG